jgi:acylphosphatase
MEEKLKLEIIVTGKVQGVGFRRYTQRCASELSITGWVKNEVNGAVRVVAVGNQSQLKILVEQLSKGPPNSQVKSLEQKLFAGETNFNSFEVK